MIDFRTLKPIQAMCASVLLRERRLMLILPRQEGKTELGVRMVRQLLDVPQTHSALFLAKSKSAGKKAVREKFFRLFDKGSFNVNTEAVIRKDHKTAICFMDSVDKDPDRLRGGTYHFIHWSEVAFSKLEHGVTVNDVFQKCITPTLRTTAGYVLLESTTNGHNGWKDLFDNASELGFKAIRISLSRLVEMGLVSVGEFEELRRTTHPDIFRQEYECEWVTFQGRAYPEFTAKHIDPTVENPSDWQMVVEAIDWGFDPSATCVLFAYVKGEVLHIFDEHYKKNEMPEVTAASIKAVHEHYKVTSFACVSDHDPAKIEELNRRGIQAGLANKVNIMGARMQIKEMFWKDRIKIHPRCKHLIRDLNAAVWETKKATKEGEIDYSQCTWGHFDAEAALRYLVRELSNFESKKPERNPHVEDDLSAAAWNMNRAMSQDYREWE